MTDLFNYHRREASVTTVGDTPMGGSYPLRVQSMATVATTDTEGCVAQARRIIEAGGEYVRFTTQGTREAENMRHISERLRAMGLTTPLVADVHFNPRVAEVAARYCEKVRINPGNYVDPARTFRHMEYTDEEYARELGKIEATLLPLLDICREHHTALRIGVNHGSLSDRIMSHYGDTPEGIVESCMEFLRICKREHFDDVVISIKASNTVVMVRSMRLLTEQMDREDMHYPLHLGVTEAGEGEDGRIKSAVGIGALLADGIGDTLRVSLSEEPECEIPVARHLADYITRRDGHQPIAAVASSLFNYVCPERRTTVAAGNIGGRHTPVVITTDDKSATTDKIATADKIATDDTNTTDDKITTTGTNKNCASGPKASLRPDFIYTGGANPQHPAPQQAYIVDQAHYDGTPGTYPLFRVHELQQLDQCTAPVKFLYLIYKDIDSAVITCLKAHPEVVVVAESHHVNRLGELRAIAHLMMNSQVTNPIVFKQSYAHSGSEKALLQIEAAADMGALMIDGLTDGLWLDNNGDIGSDNIADISNEDITDTAFAILQAARLRTTKTEYVSCPGCGRTLYDLQSTIARIKAATSHMTGLEIGIMGCIVNGPGEMADADYGYVGAGPGRISLYRGKQCVEKNIPEEEAVERLLRLIEDSEKDEKQKDEKTE